MILVVDFLGCFLSQIILTTLLINLMELVCSIHSKVFISVRLELRGHHHHHRFVLTKILECRIPTLKVINLDLFNH